MIHVRSLTKEFYQAPFSIFSLERTAKATQGTIAVSDVSFSIEQGEILGIVGESGSGKTTLARMMLRLLEPSQGEVHFRGENIYTFSPEVLRKVFRAKVRMIFQHPDSALNPAFTVQMVLEQALSLYSDEPDRAWPAIAESLLEEVGLSSKYLNKYPGDLSGGEKRRVGICRALATSPSFIIADEPVSGLDVTLQRQIMDLFLELRNTRKLTMMIITHDLSVVRQYCDRIGVMYKGQLVDYGTYESMAESKVLHPYTQELFDSEFSIQ